MPSLPEGWVLWKQRHWSFWKQSSEHGDISNSLGLSCDLFPSSLDFAVELGLGSLPSPCSMPLITQSLITHSLSTVGILTINSDCSTHSLPNPHSSVFGKEAHNLSRNGSVWGGFTNSQQQFPQGEVYFVPALYQSPSILCRLKALYYISKKYKVPCLRQCGQQVTEPVLNLNRSDSNIARIRCTSRAVSNLTPKVANREIKEAACLGHLSWDSVCVFLPCSHEPCC